MCRPYRKLKLLVFSCIGIITDSIIHVYKISLGALSLLENYDNMYIQLFFNNKLLEKATFEQNIHNLFQIE